VSLVFADTSAFLALLNPHDENHARAERAFAGLRARQAALVSTSYVLVESDALIGRRRGLVAVRRFRADFAPLVGVVWIDQALHDAGLDLLVERQRRMLSLVDGVSVVAMRQRKIDEVFAFDPHFEEEGFSPVN